MIGFILNIFCVVVFGSCVPGAVASSAELSLEQKTAYKQKTISLVEDLKKSDTKESVKKLAKEYIDLDSFTRATGAKDKKTTDDMLERLSTSFLKVAEVFIECQTPDEKAIRITKNKEKVECRFKLKNEKQKIDIKVHVTFDPNDMKIRNIIVESLDIFKMVKDVPATKGGA